MIHGDARWVYHCLRISGLTCFVSLVSVLSVCLSNQTGQVSWGLCWVAVCVSVRLGRSAHDQLLSIYLLLSIPTIHVYLSQLLGTYMLQLKQNVFILHLENSIRLHGIPSSYSAPTGMVWIDRQNDASGKWGDEGSPAGPPPLLPSSLDSQASSSRVPRRKW